MEKQDQLTYIQELIEEAKQDETWDGTEEARAILDKGAGALSWILLDL